jgi:hypothetical protein
LGRFPRKPLKKRQKIAHGDTGGQKGFARESDLGQAVKQGVSPLTGTLICQDCYPSPSTQPGLSPAGLLFFGAAALPRGQSPAEPANLGRICFALGEIGVKADKTTIHHGGRALCVFPKSSSQPLWLQLFRPAPQRSSTRHRRLSGRSAARLPVRSSRTRPVAAKPRVRLSGPSRVVCPAGLRSGFRPAAEPVLTAAPGRHDTDRRPSEQIAPVVFSFGPGGS